MKFEIYFDKNDKSFILVEESLSQQHKNQIIFSSPSSLPCLIHDFESTYQDVDDYFKKFISQYNKDDKDIK